MILPGLERQASASLFPAATAKLKPDLMALEIERSSAGELPPPRDIFAADLRAPSDALRAAHWTPSITSAIVC